MKRVRILGLVSLVLGLILILNSASSITGFVIVENLNKTVGSILGLALIIGGILGVVAREEEKEGELEKSLEFTRTKQFERSLRRYHPPPKAVDNAISKIGTGKGHEEKLKYRLGWSVRVSGAGRIIYLREQDKVILQEYDPSHYEKSER